MKPQTTLKLFDFVTANKNFINILSLAGPKIASYQHNTIQHNNVAKEIRTERDIKKYCIISKGKGLKVTVPSWRIQSVFIIFLIVKKVTNLLPKIVPFPSLLNPSTSLAV